MTDSVKEFVEIISQSVNPEESLRIALDVISDFLRQHEASQEPYLVCPAVCLKTV